MKATQTTHPPKQYRAIVRQLGLFTIPTIILITLLIIGFVLEGSQQYSLLAKAFLHGQLHFLSPIGGAGQDPVYFHGKIYWSEGPFPALLLMPFVGCFAIFHLFFYQGYIKWLLVLGVFYMVYALARNLKYTKEDSLILAFGFCLGSTFIGVASDSASWFFAQVVATGLLFASLLEYMRRRRWWLIGILCGLILMTRATAIPVVIFFGLEIWRSNWTSKRELKYAALRLAIPVFISCFLLGLYNYLRFQNPFHGGYANQLLFPASAEAESLGVFNIIHIPTNLYSLLLRTPIPLLRNSSSWTLKFPFIANNIYGMSIFITSPYLLYLFMHSWRAYPKLARHLLIASGVSCLLVVSYFGVGLVQFGYRYALDFMPELFLVFMIMYRRYHEHTTTGMKCLLLGSGIINFYMLWQLLF